MTPHWFITIKSTTDLVSTNILSLFYQNLIGSRRFSFLGKSPLSHRSASVDRELEPFPTSVFIDSSLRW